MKTLLAIASIAALTACQSFSTKPGGQQARADLEPKSGSQVRGTATFTEHGNKVLVTAKVSGLKPNSQHGFHVHEKGDCSSPDGMSAGGHFNPDGAPHGRAGGPHHAGDMPNLVADGNGNASTTFEVDTLHVDESKHGVLNHAVIVHANPDDYVSQPVGNAGGRLACGVIRKM